MQAYSKNRSSESPGRGVALVILAAGASQRMGRCKALLPLGQRTAVEHLLDRSAAFRAALTAQDCPSKVLVVAGAHHSEIFNALDAQLSEHSPTTVQVLHNPNWSEGRTGSLACAAREHPGWDLCVAPVDAPLVPNELFEQLAQAWKHAGRPAYGWLAPWVRSTSGQQRFGHPMMIGRELAVRVTQLDPQRALRELRSQAEPLLNLETSSERILDNLDTPLEWERLARLAAALDA